MALSNRFGKLVLPALALLAIGSQARSAAISRGAQDLMQEEMELYKAQVRENGRSLRARGQFQLQGAFEVVGQVSPAQVFSRGKLVPCTIGRDATTGVVVATRNSCDDSQRIYVPLTDGVSQAPTQVAPGLYLFGYENSIYPGYVVIQPGQTTRITLQPIAIPAGGTVKVFRDTTTLDEQRKIYFTTYTMGKSFFKQGEWSFGDLYIARVGNLNAPPTLDYKFCEQATLPELTSRGERICRAWNQGSFMSLMEMFEFRNDQRFNQWEVRKPGKPYAYRFNRHLVAKATTSNRATFVNVLPGAYAVEIVDSKGVAKTLSVGKLGPVDPATNTLQSAYGMLPQPELLALNKAAAPRVVKVDPLADPILAQNTGLSPEGDEPQLAPGENCATASMWRTELRSFCRADTQEGCARATARLCEPMISDLQ